MNVKFLHLNISVPPLPYVQANRFLCAAITRRSLPSLWASKRYVKGGPKSDKTLFCNSEEEKKKCVRRRNNTLPTSPVQTVLELRYQSNIDYETIFVTTVWREKKKEVFFTWVCKLTHFRFLWWPVRSKDSLQMYRPSTYASSQRYLSKTGSSYWPSTPGAPWTSKCRNIPI